MRAGRSDLLRMRLLAHAIDGEPEPSAAAVVERMLAVQAQDFAAACWALGLRARGITRSDVLADLDAGRIVRSWPMRGTLHFVPAADLGWMLRVTQERMVAGLALRHRRLELDTADFVQARHIATEALSGGRSLGRGELLELWESKGIVTTGQRGYHLIYYLAQTGVLCWGPTHRTQQALVLLDEWVPEPRRLEPDEAWAAFLLGYLRGHGPATIKDFVWWTKGTVAGARTALGVLGDAVTTLECDGGEYLVSTELAERTTTTPPRRSEREAVHLLPAFDEYLLGYTDRTPVIDGAHFDLVVPGGNGVFAPLIVSRGRVVGTWRKASSGDVDPHPFEALAPNRLAALARSAKAVRRFAD